VIQVKRAIFNHRYIEQRALRQTIPATSLQRSGLI